MGTLVDPDNLVKDSFDVFKNSFSQTHEDLRQNGFDQKKTLIPISSSGSIINGGHRLSAALNLGKDVWVLQTCLPAICCDYDYFYRRVVPVPLIEMAVTQLLKYPKHTHIAFLWPSGAGSFDQTEDLFTNVIYKAKKNVTFNGALNLLYECYGHMDWIGAEDAGFPGLQQKRLECFPKDLNFIFIVFQEAAGIDRVRSIKDEIRKINGIGFSSVHITDTKDEVLRLANILLNDNSWHFINNSKNYLQAHHGLNHLIRAMNRDNVDSNDIVVDGSFVLEAYGYRPAADIDILVSNTVSPCKLSEFERHDHELRYHAVSKENLIYDKRYFLKLCGLKIVSLNQIAVLKKNRGEPKDIIDLELIKAQISNSRYKKLEVLLRQKYLYFKLKAVRFCFGAVISTLKLIGLYITIRSLWRRLRCVRK